MPESAADRERRLDLAFSFIKALRLEKAAQRAIDAVCRLVQKLQPTADRRTHPLRVVAVSDINPQREAAPDPNLGFRIKQRAAPRSIVACVAEGESPV